MARVRAVRAAWYAGQEVDAYLRQRAWHWSVTGNYALAADYCIRLLNRHPQDTLGLVLGELAGRRTSQDTFASKCTEALAECCARKGVPSVDELVRVTLPLLSPSLPSPSRAAAAGNTGAAATIIDTTVPLLPSIPEVLAFKREAVAQDAARGEAGAVITGYEDESLRVSSTEDFTLTLQRVRRACQRSASPPCAELLEPAHTTCGRGLYATRHIAPRQPILCEAPLLVHRYDETKCAHCLAPLSARATSPDNPNVFGVSCSHCESETYCSEECRDVAWAQYHACSCAAHNKEFAAWQAGMRDLLHTSASSTGDSDPSFVMASAGSEARAALSCLTVAKLCAMATVQQVHPLSLPGISCLRGIADYEPATALSEIGALAVALSAALHQPNLYMEEVLSLFAVLQTNEFFTTSGIALYGAMSMLNHSCDPNCALAGLSGGAQTRMPMEKQLVALRPIRDGEQLFINYNANLTTKLSYDDRKALCAQRHFECFCARCIRRE